MYDRSPRAVGVVLVIVLAGLAPVGSAVAVDAATTGSGVSPAGETPTVGESGTAVDVSAVEALRLAENVTNGTSVGLELEEEAGSPVYDVTVLQQDGPLMEVVVDATEPRIRSATTNPGEVLEADQDDEADEDDAGVFEGSEGDSAGNLSSIDIRSAADAVTNASNATVENGTVGQDATVTEVELQRNGSDHRYEVEFRSPEGEPTEVQVNATTGAVLAVEGPS